MLTILPTSTNEEDYRRVIVSIHGIRTDGGWQEAFEDVFKHHFRFVRFKYGDFRHPIGAVLWIALELWAIVICVVGIFLALRFQAIHGWRSWLVAALICFVVYMVANIMADRRRNRVVNSFVAAIDDEVLAPV